MLDHPSPAVNLPLGLDLPSGLTLPHALVEAEHSKDVLPKLALDLGCCLVHSDFQLAVLDQGV